jgi:succinyl-diaminopimelate desuccinylase
MSETLEFTQELLRLRSVTPQDAGCQHLIAARLKAIGFEITHLRFGEVDNLWARKGTASPLLVFAGHTDVVPTGEVQAWSSDPFMPSVSDGYLYGRGAADMKASLAAMVIAAERFAREHFSSKGSLGFLITSDEEGVATHGTAEVVRWLQTQNVHLDYCVVGEPSSEQQLGDVIKIGRRGSLGARLIIRGVQGHIAYPHLADNPIHRALPALDELRCEVWDRGNAHFPATSWQISNIHSGTGATNVIPGTLEVIFNFRFSSEVTAEQLQERTEAILKRHQLDYTLVWSLSGEPFITGDGALLRAAVSAIKEITGLETQLSTTGGTSDARFIAPLGVQVLEFGPVNATIHKVNECVRVEDLERLTAIYQAILNKILA